MATTKSERPAVSGQSADGFGSTVWSLILAASQDDRNGPQLDRLCRRYWRPLFVFGLKSGLPRWDAEDATQEFLVYFLEKGWLKQADPEKGSFRAYLLTHFRYFLSNRRQKEQSQKRGGGRLKLSFDDVLSEGDLRALKDERLNPAEAYVRTWADCVVQAAMDRLGEEQEKGGSAARFKELRAYINQPPSAGDYERLAQTLGIPRKGVALLIHRLSRRFAELIRTEVAETLVDRTNLETELRELLVAMGR